MLSTRAWARRSRRRVPTAGRILFRPAPERWEGPEEPKPRDGETGGGARIGVRGRARDRVEKRPGAAAVTRSRRRVPRGRGSPRPPDPVRTTTREAPLRLDGRGTDAMAQETFDRIVLPLHTSASGLEEIDPCELEVTPCRWPYWARRSG